jgi:Putative beta-lactamase-inhibitor-like, PepSY-like
MKNFFILAALISMTFFGACGHRNHEENVKSERKELKEADERRESKGEGEKEELKVPEKFLAAFNQKFPGATEVEWGSESENEWEAEFTMNGKKMSVSFDVAPVWSETETEISEKELPAAVLNTLKAEFEGYKADKIEIIESPEMQGFELFLKNAEKSIEVVFDNAGKVIKKAGVKEEEEKEEKEENEKKER